MKCFIILFSYSLKSYFADSKPFEHITLCCYFSLPCVLFFNFWNSILLMFVLFQIAASNAVGCVVRQMFHTCYSELGNHMSKIKTREWEEDDTLLKECWLTMEDFFLDLGRWLSNDYLLRDLFRQTLRHFVKMYIEILMGTSSLDGYNNDTDSIEEKSTSSLSSPKMLARCMARDLESSMSFFSRYEQVLSKRVVMNSLAPLKFAAGLLQTSLEGDAFGSSKKFLEHLQSRPDVTEEAVSTS